LNVGSTRVYSPVVRSPLLFHQNTTFSSPTYYSTRPTAPSLTGSYPPYPYPYTHHPQFSGQAPMPIQPKFQPPAYPYYSTLPRPTSPSPMPFSYSVPNISYVPPMASNGLAIILIATLILVALDLMFVRPQKSRSENRSSMSDYWQVPC